MKQLLLTFTLLFSSFSYSFDLTSKPITVVIPFPPGGGVDATVKNLTKYAEKHNIKLVSIYKPGADGLIGMNEISKMPKDGYHVSIATSGNIATYQIKNSNNDLTPLLGIRNSMSAVVVNSNSNIKTFEEYENAIKNDPKFNFGFGAPGQRMLINQLTEMMKVSNKPTMIPYKGGAQVVTDLLGGHITSGILPFNIVASHIDSGALRLIAINAGSPLRKYPSATLLQQKYSAWQDFDWYCLVLPPDTSPEIRKIWVNFMKQYLSDSTVLTEFTQEYAEPVKQDQKSAEATVKTFITRIGSSQ
jgi:tripartite-type tricarboxylate transporter receptor subunit TctC